MTGGVGFGGHGRDSYKSNRELLGKRLTMKDNPYSAANKITRKENNNIQELIEWKNLKAKKEKRLQGLIWIIIGITFILSVLAYYFIQ